MQSDILEYKLDSNKKEGGVAGGNVVSPALLIRSYTRNNK